MSIITYCDTCGVLVRYAELDGRIQCPDCRAGRQPGRRASRDSGRIPYSQRPSSGTVLAAIRATVAQTPQPVAAPCSM